MWPPCSSNPCLRGWAGVKDGVWTLGGSLDTGSLLVSQAEGRHSNSGPLPCSCVLFILRDPPKGGPGPGFQPCRGSLCARTPSTCRLSVWQLCSACCYLKRRHHRLPPPVQQPLVSAQSLGCLEGTARHRDGTEVKITPCRRQPAVSSHVCKEKGRELHSPEKQMRGGPLPQYHTLRLPSSTSCPTHLQMKPCL